MSARDDLELFDAAVTALKNKPGTTLRDVAAGLGRSIDADELRAVLGPDICRFAVPQIKTGPRNIAFSDADMFDALRRASEAAGQKLALTASAYSAYVMTDPDAPSAKGIANRFGSWRNALESAGLEAGSSPRVEYERRWSDDDLTLIVADAILDTGLTSYRAYERYAEERDGIPRQIRITAGVTWAELVSRAFEEFTPGGRRSKQYRTRIDRLAKARRAQIEAKILTRQSRVTAKAS